jgi:hypothetical protein
MKKNTIKLDYTQALAFSQYLTDCIAYYQANTYEQKTVLAVIIDWQAKKILPLTFLQYTGDKTIKLTPPQYCAFVAIYQATPYQIDNYIMPKVLGLVHSIDSNILPF